MQYRIKIDREALKFLSTLQKKAKQQIIRKIDSLKTDPHPVGHKKLDDNMYRIRSGDYRIIYRIHKEQIIVHIVAIGNRKDIYRRLRNL